MHPNRHQGTAKEYADRQVEFPSAFFRTRFWPGHEMPPPRKEAYSYTARGHWWDRWERMTGKPVPKELQHVLMVGQGKPPKRRDKKGIRYNPTSRGNLTGPRTNGGV